MNALAKFSIALLLITATAIAAYLLLVPSDDGFGVASWQPPGATSSRPQDGICQQDEDRLARLRANPSLDEGLSFVSEIRCLRLWPQLQAVMDGLSGNSRGAATSRANGTASDPTPASDVASTAETTSAILDDPCKRDEDRLAELRANPSVEAAVRFDSELKCPTLQPQLPAILNQLSHTGTTEAADRQAPAPDTMSTNAAAPTPSPPASDVTSATSDEACKRDERRLAELQAKPSIEEALRLEDEFTCSRLQPQISALLESFSQAPPPTGTSASSEAPPNLTAPGATGSPASERPTTTFATEAPGSSDSPPSAAAVGETAPAVAAPQTSEAAPAGEAQTPTEAPANTASVGEAAPAMSPPASEEVMSATSDEACKRDEKRLAELQAKPSIKEALRLEDEFSCSRLQPQIIALLESFSQAPQSTEAPASASAADTNSSSEATPPPRAASESAPAASADACKRDEGRPANLQADPTADKAIGLESELTCAKLAPPQPLAILDGLSRATEAAPTSAATGAVDTSSAREASPPSLATPALKATSTVSDDACKQDEDRLARLRQTPSSVEVARFAQELRCEMLRPELLALTAALAKPSPPDSQSVSQDAGAERNAVNDTQPSQATVDADRRIAALESEKDTLAAEVSRLQRERETSAAQQALPTPAPQPASPAERSEAEVASQAAAEAERRVTELESEKEALTAEVSKLQRDRGASSAEQAKPTQPPPAAPAERSDAESAAALASLPDGMPARVLIRYLKDSADARVQADKLADALKRQGVDVADLRESRSAMRTELSFSYAPDATIARQIGRLVGVAPVRRLQPKDGLMLRPGTVEINLSGDSHLAEIKTTSTRESNHE
jgi:hypothetical protein